MRRGLHLETVWAGDPDLGAWLDRSRLNIARGLGDHSATDPRVRSALTRWMEHHEAALTNLDHYFQRADAALM